MQLEVYDRIWIIKDNKPLKMVIYSVTKIAGDDVGKVDTEYELTHEIDDDGYTTAHDGQIYLTLDDAFAHCIL